MRIDYDGTLNDVRVRAEIDVVGANALRSITRTRLMIEAGDFPEGADGAPPDPAQADRFMLRRTVFPDVIAATLGGWVEIGERRYELPNMPFAAFEEIPFRLLVEWEQAAYRENPDWLPGSEPEKKDPSATGSGALSSSTAGLTPTKT